MKCIQIVLRITVVQVVVALIAVGITAAAIFQLGPLVERKHQLEKDIAALEEKKIGRQYFSSVTETEDAEATKT